MSDMSSVLAEITKQQAEAQSNIEKGVYGNVINNSRNNVGVTCVHAVYDYAATEKVFLPIFDQLSRSDSA